MNRKELLNQVRTYFWKHYKSWINFDRESLPSDFQIESIGEYRINYLLHNAHDLFYGHKLCEDIADEVYAEYYSGAIK